jgi:hypothetical protein
VRRATRGAAIVLALLLGMAALVYADHVGQERRCASLEPGSTAWTYYCSDGR